MFLFSPDPTGGTGGTGGEGGAEGAGSGIESGASSNELMIPKYRFDEVSKKAKDYEVMVTELNAKLATLEEKDAKIAELEAKLKEVTDGHEAEKVTAKKTSIIKEKIGNTVVDFDLVVSLLDLEAIQVNSEGKVKGLSAQVRELQKTKPYLWKKAERIVKPGAPGSQGTEKTFAQKLAEKRVAANATVEKGKNYFK